MSDNLKIMSAIRDGLTHLRPTRRGKNRYWTRAVLTQLCDIGRNSFGYEVCADRGRVDKPPRHWGEWLYDVTWLKYDNDRLLVDVPLVGECEWGNPDEVEDDFQKLLLARAGVRLMVYDGYHHRLGSRAVAERLAKNVMTFNYRQEADAWLLAAWERAENEQRFAFRYFTIGPHGTVTDF